MQLSLERRIQRVAAIGAGQAGRRFSLRCALAGFEVVLEDVMPANLRRAQAQFAGLDFAGLDFPASETPHGLGTLSVAMTVEDAVRNADIAIDFVPDELESKLEIFCLIDRMAPPKTILCTPSEALSVTDLASCTYRPERCFAIRGDLASAGPVRLLRPEAASLDATEMVLGFLAAMGLEAEAELDPDAPMLVKNLGKD